MDEELNPTPAADPTPTPPTPPAPSPPAQNPALADPRGFYDAAYRFKPGHVWGAYGHKKANSNRMFEYIKKIGTPRCKVFDASAGRGHLARSLILEKYYVEASEIAPSALRELRHIRGIGAVHDLDYAHLDTLPERSFDIVVSNGVLEHLATEEDATAALKSLARLSGKWLLLIVGTSTSWWNGVDLHTLKPGVQWWMESIGKVMRIESRLIKQKLIFCAGKVWRK